MPAVRPAATAITYAGGQSCSVRQAALLDRIRAKELANSMQHDVISDVVSLSMAGDGVDVTTSSSGFGEMQDDGGGV